MPPSEPSLGACEELLAAGTERPYAIELVADATWQVYRMWARLTSAAGHLTRGKSALAFASSKTADRGSPVHLRFPQLIRTTTLVQGADRCDFRISPVA